MNGFQANRRRFAATILGLGAALLPTAGRAVQAKQGDETVANIAVVKRFLTEVVNGGKIDLVDELWTHDLLWQAASMGEVHGREAFKAALRSAVGGSFSNMKLEIKDVVAGGDKVVVRFTNSGTNTGPYRDKPATERFALWEGIGIYRLRDGKIAEAHFCEDLYGQLLMLGNG